MKIEQLIVQHLYNSKKVSLEDIGTFYLSPNVNINPDDKEAVLPENAITFEYQPKAVRDEALVDFIVQHSRKIKPLATSDLESYSILGREYLNIGKPFIIEGLGTLHKTQYGTYQFTQGSTINPKLEPVAAHLKEKDDHVIDFATPPRRSSSKRSGLVIFLVLFTLLVSAIIIYNLVRVKSPSNELTEVTDTPADTTASSTPAVMVPADTTTGMDTSRISNATFKVIVKQYLSRDAAQAFVNYQALKNNLEILPKDSGFVVVMPFNMPLSDSTTAKDSVSRTFGVRADILQ